MVIDGCIYVGFVCVLVSTVEGNDDKINPDKFLFSVCFLILLQK